MWFALDLFVCEEPQNIAHILSSIKPSRVDIIVESAHYIPHLDEKSFLYVLVYCLQWKTIKLMLAGGVFPNTVNEN